MQHRRPVAARIATIVGLTLLCGLPGLTQTARLRRLKLES